MSQSNQNLFIMNFSFANEIIEALLLGLNFVLGGISAGFTAVEDGKSGLGMFVTILSDIFGGVEF